MLQLLKSLSLALLLLKQAQEALRLSKVSAAEVSLDERVDEEGALHSRHLCGRAALRGAIRGWKLLHSPLAVDGDQRCFGFDLDALGLGRVADRKGDLEA